METDNPDQPLPKNLSETSADTHLAVSTRWQASISGLSSGMVLGMKIGVWIFGLLAIYAVFIFWWQFGLTAFPCGFRCAVVDAAWVVLYTSFLFVALPVSLIIGLFEAIRFNERGKPHNLIQTLHKIRLFCLGKCRENDAHQDNFPESDNELEITYSQPLFCTRWQAAYAGIRRGAVIGFVISASVMAASYVIFLMTMLAGVILHPCGGLFYLQDRRLQLIVDGLQIFGLFIGLFILLTIYCSFPLGIIMVLVEMFRFRKQQLVNNKKIA